MQTPRRETPAPPSRGLSSSAPRTAGSSFLFPSPAAATGYAHTSPACAPTPFASTANFPHFSSLGAPTSTNAPPTTGSLLSASPNQPYATRAPAEPTPLRERSTGPPLTSILDVAKAEAQAAPHAADPLPGAQTPGRFAESLGSPTLGSPAFAQPPLSTYRQRDAALLANEAASHWVTVFGFHSIALIPEVLEMLRQAGVAIERWSEGTGPWVHVLLADVLHQQQSLGFSGRVLHGSMLGVLPGIFPAGAHPPTALGGGLPHVAAPIKLQRTRSTVAALPEAPPALWERLFEMLVGW